MADPVSREPGLPDEARHSPGFPLGPGDTATAPTPVSRAGVQGNRRRCRRRPLRARSAADAGSGFVRARLIVRRAHVTETERALPSLQSRLESTGKRTRRLLERRQAPGTGRRTPVFLPSCTHRVARHLLPFALRRIKLNTLSSKLPLTRFLQSPVHPPLPGPSLQRLPRFYPRAAPCNPNPSCQPNFESLTTSWSVFPRAI